MKFVGTPRAPALAQSASEVTVKALDDPMKYYDPSYRVAAMDAQN